MASIVPSSFSITHNNNVSGGTYNNGNGTIKVDFNITQSIETNTSTISFKANFSNSVGAWLYGYGFYYSEDNGTTWKTIKDVHSSTSYTKPSVYTTKDWQSGTFTITHNNDGSKPNLRFRIRELYKWGANDERWSSGNGQYYNSYQNDTILTLSQIPRVSEITLNNQSGISTSGITIDGNCESKSSSFANELCLYYVENAQTPFKVASIPNSGSYNVSLTSAQVLNIARNCIPVIKDNNNYNKLKVYYSVRTYTDNTKSTLIGESVKDYAIFTYTNLATSISSRTINDTTTTAATGNTTNNIRYVIKDNTKITATYNVNLKYGATIVSAKLNGNNLSISGNTITISDVLNLQNLDIKIIDSRGYTYIEHNAITFINYTGLFGINYSKRNTSIDNKVKILLSLNFSNINLGVVQNALTIRYKIYELTEPQNWESVPSSAITQVEGNNWKCEYTTQALYDYRKDYTIKIEVKDKINEIYVESIIYKGIPTFFIGKKQCGVNGDLDVSGIFTGKELNIEDNNEYPDSWTYISPERISMSGDLYAGRITSEYPIQIYNRDTASLASTKTSGTASIEEIQFLTNGATGELYVRFKNNASTSAGNQMYVGQIDNFSYTDKPVYAVGFEGSNIYIGYINTSGAIEIRAVNNQSANNNNKVITFIFMYY